MRYLCLACDFDGTLAEHGEVRLSTLEELCNFTESNRKLVLVTGRNFGDLQSVLGGAVKLFQVIVAENGGVLVHPGTRKQVALGPPPPKEFVAELKRRGVSPLSVGECIVATWQPHESTVIEVIKQQALELQVIFNKGAVMVLPGGVNKATGLLHALDTMGLSPHNVAAIGDAENDHALIGSCECGIAVANAVPKLKEHADYITKAADGLGVEEAINRILEDDLFSVCRGIGRHRLLIGDAASNAPVELSPFGLRLLIAGPSGAGKSTLVGSLMETMLDHKYQICVIDPEGDYDSFPGVVTLGGPDRVPASSEIVEVLNNPTNSLSINLLGVSVPERPGYFLGIIGQILQLRARMGRPHFLILDEAHHLVSETTGMPSGLDDYVLASVHPELVGRSLLASLNTTIWVGSHVDSRQLNGVFGRDVPEHFPVPAAGEALVWSRDDGPPRVFTVKRAKAELHRHRRFYAGGDLGPERSFYFRGAEKKLNLRAQNLVMFLELAGGVDDDTWNFHLRKQDYSTWLQQIVKNTALAQEIAAIEADNSLGPAESRARVVDVLQRYYIAA